MRIRRFISLAVVTGLACVIATDLNATSIQRQNIAELTTLAELIIVGSVERVTDGLDGNIPYTEVTVTVAEALKGNVSGRYTFRQFGLLRPRDMGNGLTNVMVTPPGLPRYREGEQVVLFLYRPASQTGLQTTVGLVQGAFTIIGSLVVNSIDNLGLFQDLQVDRSQLSTAERAMIHSGRGPVNTQTFLSLVRKGVNSQLFK
jgi:hypothetical protein